ncbi:MAG: CoA transferase subunit A [Deltaproteobacteria bacterium]|nr:CoA transferase subunit A [Deltaproteobacteria bacterium]
MPSYLELRRRMEERDRGLREKVVSLSEACRLIRDGDHVAVGGCHYSRTPSAMIWEIIRQQKRNLTFSRSITSTEGDLLLVAGATRHIITSWFSPAVTYGVSKVMRHYTQSGEARFEEWSHLSMGLRYRAGAMGVPFIPIRTMMGSDVIRQLPEVKELECPYTGEKLVLLPALNPDVALIHVQRADPYGNGQWDGLPFMDADIALAATRVIITTERLVSNEQIRRAPDQTRIPFFCVDAVVEVPYGCVPHECYGLYEPDFDHLDEYVKVMMGQGVEGVQGYLREYVEGPASWEEFLAKVGVQHLLKISAAGRRMSYD